MSMTAAQLVPPSRPLLHRRRVGRRPRRPPASTVRDSATEEVFLSVAEAQVEDVDRAVAAAREAFDHGPWPRMTHKERAAGSARSPTPGRSDADAFADTVDPRDRASCIRSRSVPCWVRPSTFRFHAGLADTFEWEEPHVTPDGLRAAARARAGRRGRRDHSVERAERPDRLQDGAGAHRGLHRDRQGVARGARRAPICSRRSARRSVCPRACSTSSPRTARSRSGSCAIRASTRSASPARPRRAGAIGSICGERIARCTLELGGKSPAVILDDYDLDTAAAVDRAEPRASSPGRSARR